MPFRFLSKKNVVQTLLSFSIATSLMSTPVFADASLFSSIFGEKAAPSKRGKPKKAQVSCEDPSVGIPVRVVKCHDGDTCTIKSNLVEGGKASAARFIGSDAPEVKFGKKPGQAFGKDAKDFVISMLLEKPNVRFIEHGREKYGRLLGEFCAGTVSVNRATIEAGLARAYDGRDTPESFVEAQERARGKSVGIWSMPGGGEDPKDYRKRFKP